MRDTAHEASTMLTKRTKSTKKDHETLCVFRVPLRALGALCGLRAEGRRLVYLVVVMCLCAACATTNGQTKVDPRPPLDVPPAPPRVIAPLPVPEIPPTEPPVEDPEAAKPATPAKPKPQPAAAPKQDVKPETPPVETTPPPAPPPTPPTPTLTTPPQGDANAVSRQIRDSIDRTRRILDKVNYGPLSNDRKKAYDDSKLFASQADDALKANNLVFAKELADKAERLAKELQGR